VARAIDAVEQALTQFGPPIYVRRHIVHNHRVVADLEAKGAIFVKELDEVPAGAVTVLSAHGVPKSVVRLARQRGLRTLDTICPLVAKIHAEVLSHYRAGRHVLLIGHQGHPEIVGTLGQIPSGAISVVASAADIDALDLPANTLIAYAVQSTFSVRESLAAIAAIHVRFNDVAGPRSSDICYATTNRQAAIEDIASRADCVLVVGDPISSNATRLIEVAKAAGCTQSHLIAGSADLPWKILNQAKLVGLTAGASTPDEAVREVCDVLAEAGFTLENIEGNVEKVTFKPVAIGGEGWSSARSPFSQMLLTLQRDLDAFLADVLPERQGAAGRLTEAMRYAVIGGGKRMRAMLTVSVAQLSGAAPAQALRVAAAIECVHAQSLIHDDLPCMDNDDLRRGKPTVHRQFDEATAVLAGDALLALTFEILADERTHPDPRIRSELVLRLAQFIGQDGLAAGQMMDLHPPADPTREQVFACEMRKTGGLIRFAVDAGILLGECRESERVNLHNYAEKLGLAFQLRDNMLDRIGNAEMVGKKLGKDIETGRKTSVALLGIEGADRELKLLVESCRDDLAGFGPAADILSEIATFTASRLH
jgi:(E)-4-hydroxy-3-methyl-but-2-enyl pyrophosphate reductase